MQSLRVQQVQLIRKAFALALVAIFLSSCGQTPKNIVKIENGLVRTRHFSLTVPSTWRVATSDTAEVRDTYYPPSLRPIQRFLAYDPQSFTRTVEIGIYEKQPEKIADFLGIVKNNAVGLDFAETDTNLGGSMFRTIKPTTQMIDEKPVSYILEADSFYVYMFTRNTDSLVEEVIKSFRLNGKSDWKEVDVSQAETATSSFVIINGMYESSFAKCKLPDGWKVRFESGSSVTFMPDDEDKINAAMDCSVNPYFKGGDKLDDLIGRFSSALTNPKIEEVAFGKNTYKKLSNPGDGTGREMYFKLVSGRAFTFRLTVVDAETTSAQQEILGKIELK